MSALRNHDHNVTTDAHGETAAAWDDAVSMELDTLQSDRRAVLAADEWMEGMLDYAGLETALADLAAKLPATPLTASEADCALYHAIPPRLREIAQQALDFRLNELTRIAEYNVTGGGHE